MLYELIFVLLMSVAILWDIYIVQSIHRILAEEKKNWPEDTMDLELSAAETLLVYTRRQKTWKMILATIIELATKGYIYIKTKYRFLKRTIFLELAKKDLSGLNPIQKRVLNSLFIKDTTLPLKELMDPAIKINLINID